MTKEEIIIQLVSIICSSIIAIVAVVVSIISIKRQTKSQMIDANIQLFDKRFEIYLFAIDLWYIFGYFESCLDLKKCKHNYKNILSIVNEKEPSKEVFSKIHFAFKNIHKYEVMQKCLFSEKISKYLEELLINFSFYISGIYNKKCAYLRAYEHAYRDVRKMLATQDIDMAELKKFICLNDIMRNDLR